MLKGKGSESAVYVEKWKVGRVKMTNVVETNKWIHRPSCHMSSNFFCSNFFLKSDFGYCFQFYTETFSIHVWLKCNKEIDPTLPSEGQKK